MAVGLLLIAVGAGSLVARTGDAKAERPVRPGVAETDFLERKAWANENDRMRVSILRHGGRLGEVRLLTDNGRARFNPMYIPPGLGIGIRDWTAV